MPLPPDATPRRRAEILRAVAEVADKMSAATPWRASCGDSLAILGRATGAGRVTLQEASPVTSGEAAGGERLEWFASGTAAWNETATPATDNAVDDAWERELSEGRTFFGDRDELAACERHRLELRRTASIILCPVFTGGRRWGTLAFDLFAEPQRWNREEIDTLALAARVIGAAFAARQRGEVQAGPRVSYDAATEERSAHIARLSHELRTSLNAMIGLAYLANQGGAADPHAAHLRKIERVGRTLLSGINTILDFSKIEANALEIDQEPFSLATVLAGVESVILPLIRKQGLSWRVEVEPGSPAGLVGDAARLEQVLTHLATNAVKFTHTGTVCVRVAVESSGPLRSTLRFEVTDTGVGMTDEQAAAVFEGRRGAKSGGAGSFGGPGLGLMITKSLVEAMGGGLTVRSSPGGGSTFVAKLPFALALTDEAAMPLADPEESQATPPAGSLRGRRVLLAEDNEFNREVLQGIIAPTGAEVVVARDGAEAVARWSEAGPFDLVLMDLHMPEMDGLEATRRIRRLEGGALRVRIVALTANVNQADRENCRAAGMDDFQGKPVAPRVFLSRLAGWLA